MWRARRAPRRRVSSRPASAAWVFRARRLAWRSRRGSGRLRAAPRLARPARPYFYPPPSTPARPVVTLAVAQRWLQACSATLRVTRRAAAIGAGRPAGAGSRRCCSWAARLPQIPPAGRRADRGGQLLSEPGAAARSAQRVPSTPTLRPGQAASHCPPPFPEPQPGRGSGGKGRGSRDFCSVTADATPSLGDQPKDEMPCTCHSPHLLPCPGRRVGVGAEPTKKAR